MTLLDEIIAAQSGPAQEDRYRLLPTRGRGSLSVYRYGAQEARREAESMYAETGIPVMVLSAPPDGLVRAVYTVGDEQARGRKR